MEEEKSNNRFCLPPADSAPWLLYTHGNGRHNNFQTFCTLSSSPPFAQHYSKSIPQLRGKSILSSNDGWLLLREVTNLNMFTLWSPASLQTIHLPPLNLFQSTVECAIVCPPAENCDDRDVRVLIFAYNKAYIYQYGNSIWIAVNPYIIGLGLEKRVEVRDVIICNGVIYGYVYVSRQQLDVHPNSYVIIEVGKIGTDFDGLLTLRLLGVEVPKPNFSYTPSCQHLVACCGQIYVVAIYSRHAPASKRICAVCIWVLDLSLKEWIQVKCLGDRTFLVGRRSSTWCWGNIDNNELEGIQRNSVYFEVSIENLYGVPKALYLYNLEDESLMSFLPRRPYIPSSFEDPIWVVPNHHMLRKDDKYKHSAREFGLREQGLQDQNYEEHTLLRKSEYARSSNALSRYHKQKVINKFLLCDLPIDLIALVPTHMHLFDYMNFRATCKEFRCIAPLARLRENNNSYPLLMFFESEEPTCTLMDPCRNDSCYMVIPEVFGGAVRIDSCKNGWLFLNTKTCFHFFNPRTGERGQFPSFLYMREITSVGFSTCPNSPDCITLATASLAVDQITYICYHRFNEEIWHLYMLAYDYVVGFWSVLRSPIYHKGAFYLWDIRGYVGVFQLINDMCSWNVYDKPRTPNGDTDTLHSSYLVESGEELLSVFIDDMGKWVRVFMLDQSKMKWTRVRSLGNHVLFVGTASSFSVVAKEREMANRIYLPRIHERCLVYYALDTEKYGTHMSDESFEDLSGTKEHMRCSWIY